MAGNLYDALLGGVETEDRLLLRDETAGALSYRDFAGLAARLAGALIEAGFRPGDRMAVQAEKSVPALALYLATVRAGGIYLPLNIAYTPAEIEYFLNDAEPAIFVCDPSRLAALEPIARAAGAKILTLDPAGKGTLADAAAAAAPIAQTSPRGGSDVAAILYTSGTTGRSKGAMLSHDNLLSNARSLVESWRFTENDVLIHALPIFHTHGLFVATNVVLASRASMIFQPKFDPNKIMEAMPQATTLMGRPDLLYPPSAASGSQPGKHEAYAPLRVRFGAAACRNAPGMAGPHRSCDPRALRHDRDQHERLQPL